MLGEDAAEIRAEILKILFVTPYFMPAHHYGGPIESVYRLCLNLARLGCEVRVLTTNANGLDRVLEAGTGREIAVAAGLDVIYTRRVMRHAVAPGLLRRIVREVRRADVVHLTAVYSFTTIPTLIACRMLGKPIVWSPRGALQRWRGSRRVGAKWLWDRACRRLAPRATVLHVTSDQEAAESVRRMPRMSAVVIPNGVRMPVDVRRVAGDGRLRIGYLGRLDPKKGIENLLDAASLVMAEGASFTLTIAGAGPGAYLLALDQRATACGLAGAVRFAGDLRGGAKRRFFETIDLLVVPSHTENFAIVVAEALAYGVPVIASRGTPWARLEDRGCGLWVENTPAALAAAIIRMATLDLPAMGARGCEWMAAEYAWPVIARDLCNTYSSLIQGRPLGAREAAARAPLGVEGYMAAGESPIAAQSPTADG